MIKTTPILISENPRKVKIYTFELEYPRFIHSEMMTHRVFSRNASSSRAVPMKRERERTLSNPAVPIYWGENKSGMQADNEIKNVNHAKAQWYDALESACHQHEVFESMGVHKQITNRIIEPFQMIKVILTTTELGNFLHLRNHHEAQPEIQAVAKSIIDACENYTPRPLKDGEWHLPYIEGKHSGLSIEDRIIVSASCCAQVSYRINDDSLEKAKAIAKKLVGGERTHASPFEHQALCVDTRQMSVYKAKDVGFTSVALKDSSYWSGNFRDWVQYRQIM